MFFRDVLRRRRLRAYDAATSGTDAAAACTRPLSVLEELAADPEDFVDVAAVLRVDVPTLVAALTAPPARTEASWGGGGEAGGWGRSMRGHGDTRVHRGPRDRPPAVRPALAAP
jgi:hypothetical protein